MTPAEMIAWIDGATYEELLTRWRFAPAGTDWFTNKEIADHYLIVMARKKKEIGHEEAVMASKRVGW